MTKILHSSFAPTKDGRVAAFEWGGGVHLPQVDLMPSVYVYSFPAIPVVTNFCLRVKF